MNHTFSLVTTVKVGNVTLHALIDTGAVMSMIELAYCTGSINDQSQILIGTVGDGKVATRHQVKQEIMILDQTILHTFYVVESLGLTGLQLIIGMDLINAFPLTIVGGKNVEVYLEKRKLNILNNVSNLQICTLKEEKYQATSLVLCEDVFLPAATYTAVRVKVTGRVLKDGEIVEIMPVQSLTDNIFPNSISQVFNNMIIVLMLNLSMKPLLLQQGKIVAHVDTVSICPPVTCSPVVGVSSATDSLDQEFLKLINERTATGYEIAIRDILGQYRSICVVKDEPTGYTDHMPFNITTNQTKPIVQRAYRIPIAQQAAVKEQLDSLTDEGIIKISKSPWSSPMVIVKKKNGGLRLCVDYRKLNEVTVGDSYPLPNIEELLMKVRNSKFFSCLDLKSGYHQIALDESSQEKTAFCVNDKLYEYTRVPFGVKNAPAHFSRVMTSILSNLIGTAVLLYLDDIIILGATVEEHTHNLIQTLETLRRYNLKINLPKCQFFQSSVEFLGHVVTPDGIRPVHDKVEAIKNYSRPKNSKEVRAFLGLASYYRKYIPRFAVISRPLDALRKSDEFHWTEETEKAFQELKNAIMSDSLLIFPQFDRDFIVTCDASSTAIGGVVSQMDNNNRERPISFCSRVLKGAEKNYCTLDREALAIKFVLERHKYILLGQPIIVRSDHMPLKYLFKQSDLGARQARWLNHLLEFDIKEIQHIAGKKNVVADALSRATVSVVTRSQSGGRSVAEESSSDVACNSKQERRKNVACRRVEEGSGSVTEESSSEVACKRVEEGSVEDAHNHDSEVRTSTIDYNKEVTTSAHTNLNRQHDEGEKDREVEWRLESLIEEQERDPLWSQVRRWKHNSNFEFPKEIKIPRENFVMEDDVLYVILPGEEIRDTKVKTVIPQSFVKKVLFLTHSSPIAGHLGVSKTLKRAQENFYWKGMKADIRQYVNTCPECQKFKGQTHLIPPARLWPICMEKFQRIHVDLVGPLPTSTCGKRFIIVITDALTRYVFAQALPNKTAEAVAQALREFINVFGRPTQMVTDQGKEFLNEVMSALTKFYQVEHTPIKAYRPSANGLVESKNKVIINILRFLVADDVSTWPNLLSTATMALNSAYNRAIGETPHYLVFTKDPQLPYDTFFDPKPPPCYNIEAYRTYVCKQNRKIFRFVRHMLEKSRRESQEAYNKKFNVTETEICEGDRVYIKRLAPKKHKLESKFTGPFRVITMKRDAVEVRNLYNSKISTVHLSHVKLCKEREIMSANEAPINEIFPVANPREGWEEEMGVEEEEEEEQNLAKRQKT